MQAQDFTVSQPRRQKSEGYMGFGLVTRFAGHLYSRLVTTRNYSAIANPHTLKITRTYAKFSQSAFTGRFRVTNLNNGDSSASVLTLLLCSEYPTTELIL
jgi:hypothetical protein